MSDTHVRHISGEDLRSSSRTALEHERLLNKSRYDAGRGTLATYVMGFVLSLLLTGAAYLLVWEHVHSQHVTFSHHALIPIVLGLAVLQLLVQLVFFLHLSRESRPRWNALMAVFAVGVVLIVVIGSLWIMDNLNYRMMYSPDAINKYIQSQGGSSI